MSEQAAGTILERHPFEITPCENVDYLTEKSGYRKLALTEAQKVQISAAVGNLPSVAAAGAMAEAYICKIPDGLPQTLTALKQGGYGSMIQGSGGTYVGSASLYPLETAAQIFQVFDLMSIVSGQYFLSMINDQLSMIKQGIDRILEFLYGDKKAELLSEISFAKYAYQNYDSITAHEEQRAATIASLQEAKKVAMKDIEFYMQDLDNAMDGKNQNTETAAKMFQIKESLDLSIQLYVLSSLLEVYYARNFDTAYISYVESDMSVYIGKCEKQILSSFSKLLNRIQSHKQMPLAKNNNAQWVKKTESIVNALKRGEETEMKRMIHTALYSPMQGKEYRIERSGEVYMKTD